MTNIPSLLSYLPAISSSSSNLLDASGASLAIFASLYCVANHPLTFPISLLASFVNMFNYRGAHLLAHSYREVFQCLFLVYGWFNWQKKHKEQKLPITNFSPYSMRLIVIASIILSVGFQIMPHPSATLTASQHKVPYFFFFDALATLFHIFGLHLLSQRKIECWIVWMIVDFINLPLYIISELYFSAIKVTLYLFLATIGYLNWLRIQQDEHQQKATHISA